MPKIKTIELPQHTTVDRQLHDAAVDLLPSDIAEDSLVRWVTKHDGLIRELPQGEGFFGSEGQGQALMFRYMCNSMLQTRISFYFAAIFHIGRMRQVSKMVLDTILTTQQKAVLRKWVSLLAERLTGRASEEQATAMLQKLLTASGRYHSRQLALANQWWGRWQKEVEPLRENVEAMNETWGQDRYHDMRGKVAQVFLRLWMTTNVPSELQMSMLGEGVHFKSVQTPTFMGGRDLFENQSWLLPLLMAGMGDDPWHPEIIAHELRHLWEDWIQAERERRIEPQVQIAFSRLRTKYGDKNPFDDFAVGRHSATLALRELVKENMLPNDKPSPWLYAWKETLEEMPMYVFSFPPLPKPTVLKDSLWLAMRQVDSAIKENITEAIRPTESWNDFIQRIFEDEWVEKVGRMAGTANKEAGQTAVVWALDDFADFIEMIVMQLNDIGYSLQMPSKMRLKTLLDKASHGESVDDW